jgi:hypothetical protein
VTKSIKSDKSVDINDSINNDVSNTNGIEDSTMINKISVDDEKHLKIDAEKDLKSDDEKDLKSDDEKDLKLDNKTISNIPINLNYSTRSKKSGK